MNHGQVEMHLKQYVSEKPVALNWHHHHHQQQFSTKKEQAGHMHRTLVHHRLSGTEKKCFGLVFTSPCETHLPVVVCRQTSVGWRSCFDLM